MSISTPTPEEAGEAVGNFLGLPPFAGADLPHLAAAAGVLILIFLLARLIARKFAGWLDRVVAPKIDSAEHKLAFPSKHVAWTLSALAAAALLSLAASAYPWPAYSALLFDLAISLAAAMVAWRIAKAFNLAPSLALAIAIICGFQVLAARYEQLDWVGRSLDSFAVTFGESRISLLDLVNLTFAGVILYALVRVAYSGAKAFIRSRSNLDITQTLLAEKIAAVAIGVFAIFAAIDMLGIDTTALSIFSGTVGLGIGFGLQKIFSNLASGIILLMDRSIKPGDVIVVADAVGEVSKIGTRAVSVITRDGKEHLIPNELLMTERVENWNFSSRDVRIRMSVRVGYDSDLDQVEELIQAATRESPRVIDSPKPAVRVTDVTENGIKLEIRFWIRDPEDGLGNIQSEIYKRVLAKFRENKIVMPNPGREIEISKVPPIIVRSGDEA